MRHWGLLFLAILAEVVATSALKASVGLTRLGPSVLVAVGYLIAFLLFAQVLRAIPVGLAYAVWAGLGILLVTLIGWLLFGQRLDGPALLGMGLIGAGVMVVSLCSRTMGT